MAFPLDKDAWCSCAKSCAAEDVQDHIKCKADPRNNYGGWAEFFRLSEDFLFQMHFYENRLTFTMEELFQAFKDRLEHERLSKN